MSVRLDLYLDTLREGDKVRTPERRAELEAELVKLQSLSDSYYATAQRLGVHAFIEFAGLMTEMINIYRDSLRNHDVDFAMCNTHSGIPLFAQSYHLRYLEEKLDCIFAPFAIVQMTAKVARKPEPTAA